MAILLIGRRHRPILALLVLVLLVGTGALANGTEDDPFTPERNAVAWVGGCSGSLIAPDVILTAAHCLPEGLRASAPAGTLQRACTGLEQQGDMQNGAWEEPARWYPATPGFLTIAFGNSSAVPRLLRGPVEYALPRCADMALLRLDHPVPRYVARPLAVLSTPPDDIDRLFVPSHLRHAGWGGNGKTVSPRRQTGPVDYWGHNACHIVGLPPERRGGERILKGDSGAPLLMEHDGREVLVAVLWGAGNPDRAACGRVLPRQPSAHASYTPAFRPAIPGTGATDIGAWLVQMVPEAELVSLE